MTTDAVSLWQAITHALEQSGRMVVLSNTRGRWQQLGVEEPRRG